MAKMIEQFAEEIKGVFGYFDRMMLKGYIQPFLSEKTRIRALYALGVLYKDFTSYFTNVTDTIKKNIEEMAKRLGRPVDYLRTAGIRKEEWAKAIQEKDGIRRGLICVLKTLETCKTAKVCGSDEGKLVLKTANTKCLHYYLYFQDKEYGFMFMKIQTWFPFTVQVYLNGREMMKHIFAENGITYECYDNSFTEISDIKKAQELANKFDSAKLSRHLNGIAAAINPYLSTVSKTFGQGYYWCVDQCEYATDIMFKKRSFLEDIYPSLVGHAFYDLTCTDVFTFMGRKLSPQFQGEAVSDYKKRPIGCRVKFKMKSNSIKMYDKSSVLRVETTINNPREFKVLGTVHHKDGTESLEWKPMGKTIANLYRYAAISESCNGRFLDAMQNIVPVRSALEKIDKVCSRKTVNGRTIPAINVWSPDFVRIMETVCDGKYILTGFRNKDVRNAFFPDIKDQTKCAAKTSREFNQLRQQGLIRKIPRTKKYQVTNNGRSIMGPLIEFRTKLFPEYTAKMG